MVKRYKKTSPKVIIYRVMIVIFTVTIIVCLVKIMQWYINNKQNKNIQKELSKAIVYNDSPENTDEKYTVDFNTLKERNPDSVAWLKVNGTSVEHVVVKTSNNDYYLTHNIDKTYNKAGWIFADYKNKLDGTDKNIVIYGHNRKDNSMFGTLTSIIKEEWYNNPENYDIILITENGTSNYEVFSVYQIENEEYYIQTEFENETEYSNFIKTIKNRSIKNFNVEVTKDNSILTLSTCANNNKDRIVLHAKKIEE